MMKKFIPLLLFAVISVSVFAALADDPETVDGRLTEGEYGSSISLESSEQLFVEGGGK